uniref:Fibronectin type-III domain-containing protein n=1 Tax=Anabas testudineus TaxID=64144 RepID=A0A3Q1J9M4_ANATE
MFVILLFLSGTIGALLMSTSNETGSTLDCTNDFDKLMNCTFKAQNCSEYVLTLWDDGNKDCYVQECGSELCCCYVQMHIILGKSHNATIWKRGKNVESKNISIETSIKPKAPTIVLVYESNGNYRVKWTTNMKGHFSDTLTANVTYYKKGDKNKVSEFVDSTTLDGFRYFEILEKDLEPSTTYVVSVRSFTDWSGKYSDSSEEWEFTTAASSHILRLGIIVSLSIAAVVITTAAFFQIFKPLQTSVSSVSIDPSVPNNSEPWFVQQSEGSEQSRYFSAGPSSVSSVDLKPVDIKAGVQDALSKAFDRLIPSVNTSQLPESNKDSDSHSLDFDNMTYFIPIPSCPHLIITDSSEVQKQAKSICDSEYHPLEGDTVTSAETQIQVPALMPTDMSYHQCSTDSANAVDTSSSSFSTGINSPASCGPVSRAEDAYKKVFICTENRLLQRWMKTARLFTGKSAGEKKEHVDKIEQLFTVFILN